jgi:hypothetical protein
VDENDINIDATGTANPIKQWSEKAFPSDKYQQRAFQVIMSNFVLQFSTMSLSVPTTLVLETKVTAAMIATAATSRWMTPKILRIR